MEKIKILLAEDEPFLGRIIKESLETRNFEVKFVENGTKAYSVFREYQPDICVFDVSMPEMDGFSLTADIRKINSATPIIFLTARSLTEDVVKGFEIGGNDYLKKPFSMEELIVRIHSLLRRPLQKVSPNTEELKCTVGIFSFNSTSQELRNNTQVVKLSFRESSLLKLLIENKNQVLERKSVLEQLWGEDTFFNARSMDVFITKIRGHLKNDPDIQIVNIRGIGYKLIV
ncbi:response regulator transcription factor [Pedobacter cryoconitis]|uniref:DNA-binding response OmpR family regulator n=1 Tax=Pedobacter cryoconitis TaxID=188932 RepID=A0A7X0MID6_9SPHI|nr:response regulator transcription factor [Pedobacter cryoconitis]MBB6498333.1 DNA-binding response OmpR family regulator [Pedobacter cryoconitis]